LQEQQGRGGVVFSMGAFDIEGMIREKMVSINFGGAAGHEERAPSVGTAQGVPHGAWAALPLCEAD